MFRAGRSLAPGARPSRGLGVAVAAVATGAVLLAVAGVLAVRAQPAPDVGAAAARRLASPAPVTTAPAAPAASRSITPSAGRPAAAVRPGTLPGRDPTVRPVRLRIPDLGLTATVEPVGIEARTGDFAVPPSVDRVGWYRYGPGLEATAGSVVVAGHVDGAGQGPGAFFGLRGLDPGARITVTGTDGVTRRYAVVARERYAKTRIPLDRYFARDGAPRLTLITCGGPFDRRTRNYRDNIVITARPT